MDKETLDLEPELLASWYASEIAKLDLDNSKGHKHFIEYDDYGNVIHSKPLELNDIDIEINKDIL